MYVVGCRWVFKIKHNSNGFVQRYKVRLVAKGFQQTPKVDYFEIFSLVVKYTTIKVNLSVVVNRNWDIRQIDVNNAFLNGDFIETVFMNQLEGFVDT